jgi:hypothetical protein
LPREKGLPITSHFKKGFPMSIVPIYAIDAKGGYNVDHVADPENEGMFYERTKPGKYRMQLAPHGSYVTKKLDHSRIPWFADLRVNPDNPKDVQWRRHSDQWWLTNHNPWNSIQQMFGWPATFDAVANFIQVNDDFHEKMGGFRTGELPRHWVLNDFGSSAWLMIELDHRPHAGFLLHETPENELQEALGIPVTLRYSHGCIHIKRSDILDLIDKRFLMNGTVLVVHPYTDPAIEPIAPKPEVVNKGYILHFFPGPGRIVVFAHQNPRSQVHGRIVH